MLFYIILALQHNAYVYGYGESCGVQKCQIGAITASGDRLSWAIPSAAIPLPRGVKLKPQWLWLQTSDGGPCVRIKINDRTAYRLVGKRGFDLSPAAQWALRGKLDKHWNGKLKTCKGEPHA